MTIERTSAWALALLVAGGCTSNVISLDSASGGETEGTDGGTETFPPADSGSDTGPPVECVNDGDCSDCGWCSEGVCQDDLGCCSATPEQPWVWRCSPPWDCFEDIECPDGQVCNDGACEPGPNLEIHEPPACRGDLALSVEQLSLEAPLVQIAAVEGGLWAIDETLQVLPVSFEAGVGAAVGTMQGEQAVELLAIDASTLMAVDTGASLEGIPLHQIARVHDAGDGVWSLELGPLEPGPAQAATWLVDPAEAVVGSEEQLERWSADMSSPGPGPLVEADVAALASVRPSGVSWSAVAVVTVDGGVELWRVETGTAVAWGHVLRGQPIDLASARDPLGDGQLLLAVSHVEPAPEPRAVDMAAIEVVRVDGELLPAAPFGAPGVPVAIAAADVDGNGLDDVLVANADGRLDVYLMEANGPLCRMFLPLAPILELETGDMNGDGVSDVLVSDAGPGLTAIHGVAAG